MVMFVLSTQTAKASPATVQPSTPRKRPSMPQSPPLSPISPSISRRLEFLPSDQEGSTLESKRLKILRGSSEAIHLASKTFTSDASDSPVSHPETEAAFVLHKRSPSALKVRTPKVGELLPKLQMDTPDGKKYIMWQTKRYDLTSISASDVERQHQVWLGKAAESAEEVVIKTYNHITQMTKRQSIMKGDRIGYSIWQQFLHKHPCPCIQLPLIHSSLEDGVLVMDYIKVNPDKLAFWKEWEKRSTLDGLSQDAMQILTVARDLISLMWIDQVDLGDFRAENTIWKDGKLHIIDWQYIPESEKGDIVRNLRHYLKDWAKGNQAVYDFLAQPVPDLLQASTISSYL